MATVNLKAPPSLQKSALYESWLIESSNWQVFMNIGKIKQGPAILDNIIDCLDKLHFKDKTQTAYKTHKKSEMY